jgi:hypothetical protein
MMDKKCNCGGHDMMPECCQEHKMSKEHLKMKKEMLEEKLKWVNEKLEEK